MLVFINIATTMMEMQMCCVDMFVYGALS